MKKFILKTLLALTTLEAVPTAFAGGGGRNGTGPLNPENPLTPVLVCQFDISTLGLSSKVLKYTVYQQFGIVASAAYSSLLEDVTGQASPPNSKFVKIGSGLWAKKIGLNTVEIGDDSQLRIQNIGSSSAVLTNFSSQVLNVTGGTPFYVGTRQDVNAPMLTGTCQVSSKF